MPTADRSYFKPHILPSLIALLGIATKEVTKLYFFLALSDTGRWAPMYAALWMGLIVVFSTVTGYVTDRVSKKPALIATLIFSVISIFFIRQKYVALAIVINGILGNTTVVSRTIYCYLQGKRSSVSVIAETYFVQALPWVFLCTFPWVYLHYVKAAALYLSIGTLLITMGFFQMKIWRKPPQKLRFSEKLGMIQGDRLRIFIGFFLGEIAYHLMQYYLDSHFQEKIVSDAFALLGFGIVSGVSVHFLIHFTPGLKEICLIYTAAAGVFIAGAISYIYFPSSSLMSFSYYLPFASVSAFGLPLIYAGFTRNVLVEEKGFLLGCLESILALAEFLGPLLATLGIFGFTTMIALLSLAAVITYKPSYRKAF